jgi:UDP-glucose 4-epimerase
MRILITGHNGAVGSRLAKKLEREHEIVGIDTKNGENILTCQLPEDIDLIYHLAAHASVEESWKDPVRNMENITTTVRLAHAYPDTKIIYASSCATIDPASPYGFSKKGGHDYLKLFHPNSTICVFPNIYGTGRSVVDFFKGKDKVVIFGEGDHKRDYVHVDDIVEGLVKAKDWPVGEYFMGGGQIHTAIDFAEGKEVDFQPERKEAIESLIPNTTPNWSPSINVMDYLNG